jgi:histidine triad (HIT) family protein
VPRYEGVPLRTHTGDMEDPEILEGQAAKIRAMLAGK